MLIQAVLTKHYIHITSMCICACVYTYICVCVCACIYTYIYTHACIYTYIYIYTCMYMLYLYHRLECFACYIAALGLVRIYQVKHECLWYKCYVPHCPCRPIRGGNQDLLYRPLGKIRLWACTCKQEPPLYLRLSTKTGKSYGKRRKFL